LKQSQEYYENYVGTTVENIFKKYEHYDICVNELNIDLGPIVPIEIPDKLYSALERELEKYIREKRILPDEVHLIGYYPAGSQRPCRIFSDLRSAESQRPGRIFSDSRPTGSLRPSRTSR